MGDATSAATKMSSFSGLFQNFAAVLCTAIIVLVVAAYIVPDGADSWIIWPCLAMFYAICAHTLSRPLRVQKHLPTPVTIENLFLVLCFLIFFLPYQMAMLDSFDLGASRFVSHTFVEKSNQAIILSTLGVAAFYLGSLWRSPLPAHQRPESGEPINSDDPRLRPLPIITLTLLAGLIALYHMSGWRSAGEGRYSGTTSGGVLAEGVATLILMFSMIAIALPIVRISAKKPIAPVMWMALLLAAYWAIYLLAFGDRNGFLLLAMVGTGGLLTFRWRLRVGWLLVSLLVVFPVYSAIEVVRLSSNMSVFDVLFSSASEPSETSFNITTITVRAGLASVPEYLDYGYGFFKLMGVAGVIPFIRGILIGGSSIFVTTADVVTFWVLGPGSNWNTGTNIITDLYVDFGILGVPLGMFVIGRFAGWIRNRVVEDPRSTSRVVIYLITLALFAELPRYSFDFPVRILAWTALLLVLVRLLTPASQSIMSLRDRRRLMARHWRQ